MHSKELRNVLDCASEYVLANRVRSTYQFRMWSAGPVTLYSSVFAVMTLHYCGKLEKFSASQKQEWADYINSFQDPETGIYRAPEIFSGEIEGGSHSQEHLALHLVAHVLPALDLLESSPRHRLRFAERFLDLGTVREWLSQRDWTKAWLEGNNLLFVGQLLVHFEEEGVSGANEALTFLMEWLGEQVDPETGLWGTDGFCDKYTAMYGGYHQLLLYYYLRRPLIAPASLIDTVLSTQHIDGGYSRWNGGGTCQDVDAVDILVNLYKLTDHRRRDIRRSLARSYASVLRRRLSDGGFCDRIGYEFIHMGMEMTRTPSGHANMFSTWFGTHTISLMWELFKYDGGVDRAQADRMLLFNRKCSMGWHRKSASDALPGARKIEQASNKSLVYFQEALVKIYRVKNRLVKD